MTTRAWLLLTRNLTLGFVREPAAALFNLAVPFFIILVQAVAYGDELVGKDLPGYRVADVLPISAAVIFIMIIGIFGMSVGLASMIESRALAGSRLRPGGVGALLTSYGVVLIVLTLAGLALATLTLALGWQIKVPARPLAILPISLVGSVVFIAAGACIASSSGSPRSAQGVASGIFFPLLFLSGVMFPLDDFPATLRQIADALPGKHLADALTYTWIPTEPVPWASLAYLVGFAAANTWLAIRLLRRREDV